MAIPVISVAQMREWEAATWASGQTESEVIARVGARLAARALELTRPADWIVLLAGKGHNGDDARAMQPHLPAREVTLVDCAHPVMAAARLRDLLSHRRPALIVDGLFGIGLNRPLNHDWLSLLALVNHAHAPVLAIDVPSGLDAETGEVMTAAIVATETVTVGAPKRGMLVGDAPAYVGRLRVADDVGLVAWTPSSDVHWTLPSDFTTFPPARGVGTHKGSYGHVAIVAGSLGFHGAAVLASRGAQRARPGLITLFPQPETYLPVAAQTQAVMVSPWQGEIDWTRFSAVLIGPGLAAPTVPAAVAQQASQLWKDFDGAVVVDASALGWLPPGDTASAAMRVITPHPGEAARLLGVTTADIQCNRQDAARALSRRFGGCGVVLKGHQTVVGRGDGNLFVNCSGSPGLAQGGSGDLLAGFIAGWFAQPVLRTDPETLLRYAVWEHGAAADRLDAARATWTVEELAAELGCAHR